MQKRDRRNRRRITAALGVTGALAGATLTGAALIGASAQREAEKAQAKATEFPFTTLTPTQRMHLNVANVTADTPDTQNPPDTTNPPDTKGAPPCRVLFRLFDSEGRVVATATSMLEAGKTAQLTVDTPDGADSPDTTPARIPGMRGEILVPEGRCGDAVLGSLEVIDTASGEVRAVIAPTRSLRVPQTMIVDPPDITPR